MDNIEATTKVVISLRTSPETRDRVRAFARRHGISVNSALQFLINGSLERLDRAERAEVTP